MADTRIDPMSEEACQECDAKEKGSRITRWGPLVPEGAVLCVCGTCWKSRAQYYNDNGSPKPLPKKMLENG